MALTLPHGFPVDTKVSETGILTDIHAWQLSSAGAANSPCVLLPPVGGGNQGFNVLLFFSLCGLAYDIGLMAFSRTALSDGEPLHPEVALSTVHLCTGIAFSPAAALTALSVTGSADEVVYIRLCFEPCFCKLLVLPQNQEWLWTAHAQDRV